MLEGLKLEWRSSTAWNVKVNLCAYWTQGERYHSGSVQKSEATQSRLICLRRFGPCMFISLLLLGTPVAPIFPSDEDAAEEKVE